MKIIFIIIFVCGAVLAEATPKDEISQKLKAYTAINVTAEVLNEITDDRALECLTALESITKTPHQAIAKAALIKLVEKKAHFFEKLIKVQFFLSNSHQLISPSFPDADNTAIMLESTELSGEALKRVTQHLNQLFYATMSADERKELIHCLKNVDEREVQSLFEAIQTALPKILSHQHKCSKDLVLVFLRMSSEAVTKIGASLTNVIHPNADTLTKINCVKLLAHVRAEEIENRLKFIKAQAERLCEGMPGWQQFHVYDALVKIPLPKIRHAVDEVMERAAVNRSRGMAGDKLTQQTLADIKSLDHKKIDPRKTDVSRPGSYRPLSYAKVLLLEQVSALKYLDCSSKQYAAFLEGGDDLKTKLQRQQALLEERIAKLRKASALLTELLSEDDLSWGHILETEELFEEFTSEQEAWAFEALTKEEKIARESKMVERDEKSAQVYLTERAQLMSDIQKLMKTSPESDAALLVAERWIHLMGGFYGSNLSDIQRKVWEQGVKKVLGGKSVTDPKSVEWLTAALDYYWRKRIHDFLREVQKEVQPGHCDQWQKLMVEMCGDSEEMKGMISETIAQDPHIGDQAKAWVARTNS